jgi:hypothetical protein
MLTMIMIIIHIKFRYKDLQFPNILIKELGDPNQ